MVTCAFAAITEYTYAIFNLTNRLAATVVECLAMSHTSLQNPSFTMRIDLNFAGQKGISACDGKARAVRDCV